MKSLKKIELHLHLEGAAPAGFLRDLAARRHESLEGILDGGGRAAWREFRDFLRAYDRVCAMLHGPMDYARLLAAVLSECAEQGAIYVELFVAPEFCGGADLPAWQEHLAAMEEVARAAALSGIESRAIATCLRHLGPERARRSALCAAETAGGWVAGLGLAGAEDIGRPQDFAWAFDCAREAGLGLTAHAGEWGGPESVRGALELGVSRIGHGIRAIEDRALVAELASRGITLELCPGSNVALGIVPRLDRHPIARLLDAGVRVTVSTDDPPFFGTSLVQEYQGLADCFGWDETVFRQFNLWAAEAAFCDAPTRERLIKELS